MSTKHLHSKVAPQTVPEDSDDAYFGTFEPGGACVVSLEHFQKDAICSHCGYWRSEHDWNICKQPNYIT